MATLRTLTLNHSDALWGRDRRCLQPQTQAVHYAPGKSSKGSVLTKGALANSWGHKTETAGGSTGGRGMKKLGINSNQDTQCIYKADFD